MINKMVSKLEELVKEARAKLRRTEGCYTDADRRALEDMTVRAEQALAGKKPVFTRNREFLKPRQDEEILFAYDRYTMAPTFFEQGKVYGHYGLKEAVKWFDSQDMKKWPEEKLEIRRQEILKMGGKSLASAQYGDDVGQYDRRKGEKLRNQLEVLKHSKREELAENLRKCINAAEQFQFSQKLYSEETENPLFLLSEEKRSCLRSKIEEDSLVSRQYEKIKAIAGETSLEDCKTAYLQIWNSYSYEELNKRFSIWGDTGKGVNIITPPKTRGARLSFCLPGEENEGEGLGHIWITGIEIFSAHGPRVPVPNDSFTEGQEMAEGPAACWKMERKKGNPVCRREKSEKGETCLYLCNTTADDEITVVCGEVLPLVENSGYTLFFRAKQDGKFKKGFQVSLDFLDEEGKVIDRFTYIFNRKSTIPTGRKALSMQCAAIVYALEGEMEYAWKAKYHMLAFLNDFCQGAEYWMVYNERPEGCDAYGAVQAGRIMCSAACTYSLIRDSGILSEEDKKFFYGLTDYLLQYCLDMRDRKFLSRERVQRGASNWQTDMCIGVAALMSALPDYPERRTWLYNARAVLAAQLEENLNSDGSWPESIRYHHAALEHFASFASLWKQETGENWLATTRLKDMFAYTIHTITPPYEYFDGCIGTPPFGDHRLSGGTELGIYGLYIEDVAKLDKKLADEMYQVWQRTRYTIKGLSGESLVLENLLYTEPDEFRPDKENDLELKSTSAYPDSGIYVFRHQTSGEKENYLAVMGAVKPIGHGHLDQGSFVLYYHNYPVIMDSGIEGYFDTSTQWHLSSYSHACLQFAATEEDLKAMRTDNRIINLNAGNYSLDRGWLDVPRVSESVEAEIGIKTDKITLEIEHPCGRERGVHQRTILFEKQTGMVTIQDRVENYTGTVLFSLPMVMKEARIDGQKVLAAGHYSVDMEIEFLSPVKEIFLEKGRTTPLFPTEEEIPMLLYVRAKADAHRELKVRIKPLERGSAV